MKTLTNKQAYEIIRDNTSWTWVYPQDVKFKYGWIFHRTRDCCTGKFYSCKEPIDMYAIDNLYSYEHTGYQIEPWSGCEMEDSPFKKDNDSAVIKLIREVNRQYKSYKDDEFIEKVFKIAFTKEDAYFSELKDKYTRDDVLERLMEMSNDSLKLEEVKQCK